MVISWYGQSCFKIQSGDLTLIIDPFDKSIGLTPPRQIGADIVIVSHEHPDHNNVASIGGDPFIINSPGEYDIKGVKVRGIFSFHDNEGGKERGVNTIYIIGIENMRLCHFGDFGQKDLTEEQIEDIGNVDILMIPVGGHYTLDAKWASEIIKQIEPKIIIPMHYNVPNLNIELDSVDKFLKEMGADKKEAVEKLTIKKKELPMEETEVVVLKS